MGLLTQPRPFAAIQGRMLEVTRQRLVIHTVSLQLAQDNSKSHKADATHLLLLLKHLISFKNYRNHGLERHGWRRKALLHRDVYQRGPWIR